MYSQVPKRLYAAWALVLLVGVAVTRFWTQDIRYFYLWIGVWAAVVLAYETWTFWHWWRNGRR